MKFLQAVQRLFFRRKSRSQTVIIESAWNDLADTLRKREPRDVPVASDKSAVAGGRRFPGNLFGRIRNFWRPPRRGERPARLKLHQRFGVTGFLVYWALILAIWVAVILAGTVTVYSLMAPDPLEAGLSKQPAKLRILAENGKVIAEKGLRRHHVPLEKMPPHVIKAVLSTEDQRFYYHFGFDPIGILRASIANYRAGRIVQGGSTITQQLVKVLFLKPERTYWRKIEEILLALSLEYRFEKNQILELYLNRIYFGAGNYGIEAAAQHYFGKSVSDVGIYEAAILAGLIKSPSFYAPTRDLQRALDRGKLVLQNMLNNSAISVETYRQAIANPPDLRAYLPSESYGYVIDWVVELVSAYGQNLQTDMVVETTIDYELQGAAQQIVKEDMALHGKTYSAGEAAAVILDPRGAVKALVGGRNYGRNQFNRVVKARRQPGSTFKPFIFLTALEKGLTPESIVHDGDITIGDWSPRNYNDRFRGDVTLREGLSLSLNSVAVRLSEWVGRENVIKTAHRLGINSGLKNNPSIALGTSEVSLLEITAAYAPFANGGFAVLPHVIKKIRDQEGNILFQRGSPYWGRVMSPHLVSAMNDMLTATIKVGTGRQAALDPHPAAGKTGTGQNYRDAWFIGYTAHYVTGVWIGNDDFTPMKRVTGGSLPTMIWRDLMLTAHVSKSVAALPGQDWQQAGNLGRREGRSLWDALFGGPSGADPTLGSPSSSSGGRGEKKSWVEDVFKGN